MSHNGKYILKENEAIKNQIPSTSLVSEYKLSVKDVPLTR